MNATLLLTLVGVATGGTVHQTETATIGPAQRTLAAGAAVFPGILLHGSGHWVAGDSSTAALLLGAEGIGVLSTVGGLVGLALTGASPKTVGIFATMTAGGFGIFSLSFIADLYGVLAPEVGVGPPPVQMPIETALGVAYVSDRVFDYSTFATWRLDLRDENWRYSPSAWVALDDDNARLRGEVAYRLTGAPRQFLDLETALTHHHYGTDGFALTTVEIAIESRIDLGEYAASLDGAFVDAGVGVGLENHRLFDVANTTTSILLGGFSFGAYLPGGEAAIYYDHRHDEFSGGTKANGLGSGVPGHFGARWRMFFGDLGFEMIAETGSAHVVNGALVYRGTP